MGDRHRGKVAEEPAGQPPADEIPEVPAPLPQMGTYTVKVVPQLDEEATGRLMDEFAARLAERMGAVFAQVITEMAVELGTVPAETADPMPCNVDPGGELAAARQVQRDQVAAAATRVVAAQDEVVVHARRAMNGAMS